MSHDSPNSARDGAQTERLLARLAERLDAAHERLARLSETAGASAGQIDSVARHLTSPEAGRAAAEQMAALAEKIDALEAQLSELSTSMARLNRTQFKANTLFETQEQRAAEAIALLRDLIARREESGEEIDSAEREDLEALRAGARAELVADLLPSIDGIDNAIESGRALLARRALEDSGGHDRHGFLWRLTHPSEAPRPAPVSDATALEGWLRGLELVRERFLALLAREGVRQIRALGEPFDPHLHVAVGAREGGEPGTVIEVVRAGYARGETVLRFAEVVVARARERAEVVPAGEGGR